MLVMFCFVSCAGLIAPSPLSFLGLALELELVACGFGVSEEGSLCRGDEWTGEADFLLCESPFPLPPLDELRGETRPVWGLSVS